MPAEFALKYHDIEACRDSADLQPIFAEATVLLSGEAEEGNSFDWQEITEGIEKVFRLHGHDTPGELVCVEVEVITPEDDRFEKCKKLHKEKEVLAVIPAGNWPGPLCINAVST